MRSKCSKFIATALLLAGGLTTAPAVEPPTAEQMQAILKGRAEMDEIRWKDPARGAPLKVRITSSNAQSIVVEKTLPAGLTVRTIPLAELAGIGFTFTPREAALHQRAAVASIPALKILWENRQATMRLPGSNVAETGIVLAKSLRLSGDAAALDEAEKILDQVRGTDLLEARKEAARAERATLDFVRLLKHGKLAETDAAAWKITGEPDNPDAMLLATAFLADRHFNELKSIEDRHPRWMEDEEVRPLRERLYHLALDFSLYPSLFIGTRQAEAAAGLQKVAEIHRFTHEKLLEKAALEDLAALYPDSDPAKETAPLLEQLKKAEAAGALDKLTAETKPEDDEAETEDSPTPAAAPPPPKRYNLFGD